jgi:hypothetical protein
MLLASILYEDGQPVRAWKGSACIYNAYCWAHQHYNLHDLGLRVYQLPDWLEVQLLMTTEEKFNAIVG